MSAQALAAASEQLAPSITRTGLADQEFLPFKEDMRIPSSLASL